MRTDAHPVRTSPLRMGSRLAAGAAPAPRPRARAPGGCGAPSCRPGRRRRRRPPVPPRRSCVGSMAGHVLSGDRWPMALCRCTGCLGRDVAGCSLGPRHAAPWAALLLAGTQASGLAWRTISDTSRAGNEHARASRDRGPGVRPRRGGAPAAAARERVRRARVAAAAARAGGRGGRRCLLVEL